MLEGGAPESSRTKNKRQGCCGADPGAQQEVEFPANGVGEGSPTSKPLFSRWWPCSAQCETESQSSFNVSSPDG